MHETDLALPPDLGQISIMLELGKTTSRELVEMCLARITDEHGEGSRTFLAVNQNVRAEADYIDALRRGGRSPSRYAGIPISIKDLFDIKGETTRAGSIVLREAEPASADAPAIARLRAAGFVFVGRTNMTEFAYSGLGLNPHFGTPKNPYDRHVGRIPGGSSSGAAISVTDGMVAAGIGSDTGGSCRIPAALTGIVGFKPTASRVPRDGVLPLSSTLDSIGSLATSVASCALLDSIMATGKWDQPGLHVPPSLHGLKLLAPTNLVFEGADEHVVSAFYKALKALIAAGAEVITGSIPEIDEIAPMNSKGGFASAESYAWHRDLLAIGKDRYDPRVRVRIEKGAQQTAADYVSLHVARQSLINRFKARLRGYSAMLLPTTPIIAPTFKELESDSEYDRLNLLILRNPSIVNMLDGCAVSVPCHRSGEPPVGLMIAGMAGDDARILGIAQAIETIVSPIAMRGGVAA